MYCSLVDTNQVDARITIAHLGFVSPKVVRSISRLAQMSTSLEFPKDLGDASYEAFAKFGWLFVLSIRECLLSCEQFSCLTSQFFRAIRTFLARKCF